MKLAAQEGLVPRERFADKLRALHEWGYDGVELNGRQLSERLAETARFLREQWRSA